jgi:hypothetical protein
MVEDVAILCGLGLIYLAMFAMIISLWRIFAAEDKSGDRPSSLRG